MAVHRGKIAFSVQSVVQKWTEEHFFLEEVDTLD